MPESQAASALGFTRTPSEDDPRRDPQLLDALERIAPGTQLRQAIDDVIRSHEGALIVVGDPAELSFLYSGGMRLDQPFTPQFLYELAKMDGAIIVNPTLTKIAYANVQLMPDPTIPSNETGTRHRTAERAANVHDYHADGAGPRAELSLEGLHALPYRQLLEVERIAELLGYGRDVNPLDHSVSPRGYRILSHIPRLPEPVVKKVVAD